MRSRRPRLPMWTDDPVRDAERWEEYKERMNDWDEDTEDDYADREYEDWRDRYGNLRED